MSNNPFRRQDNPSSNHSPHGGVSSARTDRPETHTTPINTDIPRPAKSKTGKTVRIISPHSASSDLEKGVAISTPIPSPSLTRTSSNGSGDQVNDTDPFDAASDGQNTLSALGSAYGEDLKSTASSSSPSRASSFPANPFKKTLATLEKGAGTRELHQLQHDPKLQRPQYDVDDFKKLLLTGEKPSTAYTTTTAPAAILQTQPIIGDSSSNTDASSASRQSLFEPISGPLHESPRTSQEISISDDERQRLVGTSPPKTEKTKPSAPRHRHGKLVKANAPQTVSFEDPMLSFSTAAFADTVSRNSSKTPGSPNDIQKAPPTIIASYPTNAEDIELTDSNASPPSQKKPPPTPPARRQAHLRSKPLIADSGRSSPISEEALADITPHLPFPPIMSSKPTPPPPRRSSTFRHGSSSSIPTAVSDSMSPDQPISSTKPAPPTPPTRSPSLSAAKRPPQASPQAGSPTMPPPPPPRRRGSSQSSYTPSRLSGDYRTMVSQRPRGDSGASSISQLQMTPLESSTDRTDVLADLSALQREVDELRGKIR